MKTAIIILIVMIIVNNHASKLRKTVRLTSGESDKNKVTKDEIFNQPEELEFIPIGCRSGASFCENPSGYPSPKYLKKMVPKLTEAQKLILLTNNRKESSLSEMSLDFSVLPRNPKKKPKAKPAVEMSEDHDWYQESPLCDTRTSYVYPKAALNQNLQWRYSFQIKRELWLSN